LNIEFAKRLKKALNAKNLTQIQAAQAVGITNDAFTNYMKGRIPKTNILLKLAQLCDVNMEWFITGNEQYDDNSLSADEKELLLNYSKLSCLDKGKIHGYMSCILKGYSY